VTLVHLIAGVSGHGSAGERHDVGHCCLKSWIESLIRATRVCLAG
jgi:hypothetical protein